MFNLLLDDIQKTMPDWMSKSFPIVMNIMLGLIAFFAIVIIAIIMVMESNTEGGTNVISGQSESFYSKNQGSSKEGRLKKAIVVCGILIAVVAVAFWILWAIWSSYNVGA